MQSVVCLPSANPLVLLLKRLICSSIATTATAELARGTAQEGRGQGEGWGCGDKGCGVSNQKVITALCARVCACMRMCMCVCARKQSFYFITAGGAAACERAQSPEACLQNERWQQNTDVSVQDESTSSRCRTGQAPYFRKCYNVGYISLLVMLASARQEMWGWCSAGVKHCGLLWRGQKTEAWVQLRKGVLWLAEER